MSRLLNLFFTCVSLFLIYFCLFLSHFFIFGIKFYRFFISPLLPPSCRFYPCCSEYCMNCLRRHGLIMGGFYCLVRLVRCNPWYYPKGDNGFYDPVPDFAFNIRCFFKNILSRVWFR